MVIWGRFTHKSPSKILIKVSSSIIKCSVGIVVFLALSQQTKIAVACRCGRIKTCYSISGSILTIITASRTMCTPIVNTIFTIFNIIQRNKNIDIPNSSYCTIDRKVITIIAFSRIVIECSIYMCYIHIYLISYLGTSDILFTF